jgi:hypothetical protein
MHVLQRSLLRLSDQSLRLPIYSHRHTGRILLRSRPNAFSTSRTLRLKDSSQSQQLNKAKREPVDIPIPLWYHRLGPVSNFFSWFHRTQVRRPLTVQLCTTLITYLCGDLLAQNIGGEPYDPWRTLRMLTIGGLASLPGYKW